MQPHRRQPTRLPRPWDSPGKNTGAGCHFLLQCMKVKSESEVAQSCPALRDPMDCSLPGSSVHGIFHARVLEWGAIAFSNNILGRRKGCLTRKSCWFHFQGISLIGSPHPLHCIPLDHCSNFLPVLRFYLLPLALLCTVLFTEHAARVAPLLSTLHLCMHAQSCLTLQPHGL